MAWYNGSRTEKGATIPLKSLLVAKQFAKDKDGVTVVTNEIKFYKKLQKQPKVCI
jgi:hypothetical protein